MNIDPDQGLIIHITRSYALVMSTYLQRQVVI